MKKNDGKNTNEKRKRIVVLLGIILVVLGIFVTKNMKNNISNKDNTSNEETNLIIDEVNMDELTKSGLPIIIDFGSDSCMPCKEMAPVLEKMNKEMKGRALIHFVDVWKNENAADGFPVEVIPTQVIFDSKGNPFMPSNELANKIEFSYYSLDDTKEHNFTIHKGGLTEEEMSLILKEMGVNSDK